jgi:hypothetical protein
MAAASFRRFSILLLALAAIGAVIAFEWVGDRGVIEAPQLAAPQPAKSPVWVQSLTELAGGRFEAKGGADPNAQVRLYLNGSYLAELTAGPDGRWEYAAERGVPPGRYVLRSDVVDRLNGGVTTRAEVRFAYAPDSPSKALPPPTVDALPPLPQSPASGHSPTSSPAANQSPYVERMNSLGAEIRNLPKGKIFLDAPATMMVGEAREVEARVGIDAPLEALKGRAPAGARSISGVLAVSNTMSAELTGASFEIVAESPKLQSVAAGYPTVWRWKVRATEDGDRELEATLRALVTNGDPDGQFIDSFKASVKVSVKPLTWTESLKSVSEDVSAAQAIAVALVAMATALLGWLGFSRVKQGAASPDPAKSGRRGYSRTRLRNKKVPP